jgi:hypothetical protein
MEKRSHPFLVQEPAEYFWCLHCEKAYPAVDWEAKDWWCPGVDCSGSALDAHPWVKENWPREHHPEYPEVPAIGVYYPLYGPGCVEAPDKINPTIGT